MRGKEQLKESLQKLAHAIYSTVNEGLAKGTLRPEYEPFFKWNIGLFEYDDNGVKSMGIVSHRSKPTWYSASRTIEQKVERLSIYKDTLKITPKVSELGLPAGALLSQLVSKVAWDTLENRVVDSSQLTRYVISFLDDLYRKEHEYRAEVQLRGLVLRPDSIQLDAHVRLRKPAKKDLEREELALIPYRRIPLGDPTAILQIRMRSKSGGVVIQNEIDRDIAILRLFRVSPIQSIRYTLDTDSILDATGRGTITPGIQPLVSDKYLIREEDVEPLKTFWANMKRVELPIPSREGKKKEPTELSIAYERYSDSLEGGVIEKRIASAVMGLEALYLTEIDELAYRLSMRVGKLLSLTDDNYKSCEVRDNLKTAYKIRNKYVHGATLKAEDRRELEEKQFARTIIDYLRASIVALFKRSGKTALIDKIDESFLNNAKEDEIRKLLFMPHKKEELNATG